MLDTGFLKWTGYPKDYRITGYSSSKNIFCNKILDQGKKRKWPNEYNFFSKKNDGCPLVKKIYIIENQKNLFRFNFGIPT